MEDKAQISVQKDVIDYFKDIDDTTVIDIIECFVYGVALKDGKSQKIIDKFLNDNGIMDAYINYLYDENNPQTFWRKLSMSESSIIQKVKIGMLNMAFNRFRDIDFERRKLDIITKKEESSNKKNFKFMKNQTLEMFECLNRSESYFYGKKEDKKMVDKINKITFE